MTAAICTSTCMYSDNCDAVCSTWSSSAVACITSSLSSTINYNCCCHRLYRNNSTGSLLMLRKQLVSASVQFSAIYTQLVGWLMLVAFNCVNGQFVAYFRAICFAVGTAAIRARLCCADQSDIAMHHVCTVNL